MVEKRVWGIPIDDRSVDEVGVEERSTLCTDAPFPWPIVVVAVVVEWHSFFVRPGPRLIAATPFFERLGQRYACGSTMLTSNLPFAEWTGILGSERLTGVLLDRLTHHVHILVPRFAPPLGSRQRRRLPHSHRPRRFDHFEIDMEEQQQK